MRLLLFFLLLAAYGQAQTTSYQLAFQRGNKICVFDEKTSKVVPLIQGDDPCLSPDGTKVAYTSSSNGRKVAVYSISTKKHLAINVGNHTSYAPVWSPDGNYLAFQTLIDGKCYTGLYSFLDHSFKLLTQKHEGYAPSWTSNGERLLVQDMNKLYIYERNGRPVKNYALSSITKDYSVSSNTQFIITPDQESLVFVADYFDNAGMPVGVVCMYHFKTSKLTRLSPKGMSCRAELFLNNQNEVFFSGSNSEDVDDIYRVNLTTKKLTPVIRNGHTPSGRFTSSETTIPID